MELIPGLFDDIGLECLTRVPFHSFPSVSSVCRAWNLQVHNPHFHRIRNLSGLTRPVFILSQARPSLFPNPENTSTKVTAQHYWLTVFEPGSGSWTRLPPEPGLPNGLPMFCGLVGVGSGLVVVGGWDPVAWQVSKAVYVFDFLTGQWRRGTDMPGPARWLFGVAGDPERRVVIVAGGHGHDKVALRSACMYDVENDTWVPLADMANERDECSVVCQGGRFHVIGGYETKRQGSFGKSAETLDPDTGKWCPMNETFLEESASWAIGNGNGEIYSCRDGYVAVQKGDKWEALVELPDKRRSLQKVMMWRDTMVVFEMYGEHPKAYMLDLKSGKWSKVDMPEEYSGHVQLGCGMEL